MKTLRTSGESLLLTIEQFFFFKIRNYAMECRQQQGFLKLASVKSIKTVALFSFVIILNIMVKNV